MQHLVMGRNAIPKSQTLGTVAHTGEKFKKAQVAEHQVLKREHSQKAKRAMELRKKRFEQYMWTTSSRLRPEPITDVKIYPNTKPAVLTVHRENDRSNFQVHNPFKFADFGVTELDELGPIIQKKKNTIVKDLMTSLGRKRKHMELEPEIKVPGDLDIVDDEGIFVGDLMYNLSSGVGGYGVRDMNLFCCINVEGDDGEGSLGLGIMAFLSELVILLDS
ncbi:hypothetical protein Tco_1106243 [Tanacetum coccineum]